MERMHLTAAMPLLAISTCNRKQARQKSGEKCNYIFTLKKNTIWKPNKEYLFTFSMTRVPPNRVTNSAGEATVKSLCRSIFLCSRPFFTKWRPDMLGLRWRAHVNLADTQLHGCLHYLCVCLRLIWNTSACILSPNTPHPNNRGSPQQARR